MPRSDAPGGTPGRAFFATTRWSIVLHAGDEGSTDRERALATLCENYWYPLYAFLRREGSKPEDAQDLTQGFFARFLEKNYLQSVRQERGRFRSYLLGALKHYRANERDKERAQKRGGGQTLLSLDFADAEQRYKIEPTDDVDAEKLFERQWALTLVDTTLARLRGEFEGKGKGAIYERLKGALTGGDDGTLLQAATDLGMKENAVKVTVHRMRKRFGELLRAEVAHTVESADEVDTEIQRLFETLG